MCSIDSKLSLDETTMSDNNDAMHVAIGVAIGALATTITADVFKGIKDLSYGIRNRIYIVYASIFEVRSLTISESSGNTSMPAVLLGHGIRTFDAVAKYEINEVVKASTQVGQTYLPTRAWSIYFMSMLGWTHTVHATHNLQHITLVGPSQAIDNLCAQCNASEEEDKVKFKELASVSLGKHSIINPCDKYGMYLDLGVFTILAVVLACCVSVWSISVPGAFIVYYAWVLCTSTFQPYAPDVVNLGGNVESSEHGSSSPVSACQVSPVSTTRVGSVASFISLEVPLLEDTSPLSSSQVQRLREITVSFWYNTGKYFELVNNQHYQKSRSDSMGVASTDDILWLQVPHTLAVRADMDMLLETVTTDFVYVCVFDPTRDISANNFIAPLRAAEVPVTLMLVLPDLDGMLKSFDKGMLFGSTDVYSKSSLDHWILQVTSGQFKHLRLVIPMTNFNEDEWPTLSRVYHVDLTWKRCGLM